MSTMEKNIIASVYVIYIARKITSRIAIECYILLASFIGMVMLVSLPHIAQNFSMSAQHGLVSMGSFTLSALMATRLSVQIVLLIACAALFFLLRDILRATFSSSTVTIRKPVSA